MKPQTLYITRSGLLEPLGQSQVMAYLRGLSRDYAITLITYEKPEDTADADAITRIEAECKAHGIRWLPQHFCRRPKLLAPAWSMVQFLWLCLREVRAGRAKLIHCRSYVPSTVALLVSRLTGVPFIFDMRALWPEELITAGRLKRGSLTHRAIVWAERACLKNAAAVVSLTQAAAEYLHKNNAAELVGKNIDVIPTCADLDRFVPLAKHSNTPRIHGCLGTVTSGWFKLDWLAAYFRAVAHREPTSKFHVISRDDPDRVRAALGGDESFQSRLSIYSLPPHEVHKAVQQQHVSAMFFSMGLAKLGSSPTRMGEVLGCGLPVVTNVGVGDVAQIIAEYRVGVLVKEATPVAMEEALETLAMLEADADLRVRCRKAAEAIFSLTEGTQRYRDIYVRLLRGA